jgi:hypothetical protein
MRLATLGGGNIRTVEYAPIWPVDISSTIFPETNETVTIPFERTTKWLWELFRLDQDVGREGKSIQIRETKADVLLRAEDTDDDVGIEKY